MSIEIANIKKSFGRTQVLNDISLDIPSGQMVALLGPSGSGKTTLLRIIAGLEQPSAGRLWQRGREITQLPPAQRDYGIVFQSYALFPNLSVADNVAYGLVNRRVPQAQARARVAELLALVGLPDSQAKYPAQLSGGQQQRIALARALATSPGLLLLDEPLSALDAIVRVHLRSEIKALQRQLGVTTIMVTHDQEEALAMADRIVVMDQGAIAQVGTPLQVYREPATPFVADFVGRVNVLHARAGVAGQIEVGGLSLACPAAAGTAPGTPLTLYLRPEDVLVQGSGQTNLVQARIEAVEFLGAFCLVDVSLPALGGQRLQVQLSMNVLAERGLAVGSPLVLQLLPERMRVFGGASDGAADGVAAAAASLPLAAAA
ncbi:MAG: ABC transporter ATP-binding protein [Burkholderiales bacterium PBB5]|nr:MAG: ABC transporter ATP-binding protein [Burkholderiales bacterium PBB5]